MTRRAVTVVLAVVCGLLTAAGPASALGVDGVGLTPGLPRGLDGRHVLEVGTEPRPVDLRVRNRTDEAREVRVYAVAAAAREGDGFDLGAAGSVTWLDLDRSVVLDPGAEERMTVTVDPRRVPEDVGHVAFVVEAGTDTTVVTRAATVVRVRASGLLGSPRAPVAAAALLLGLLVAAHLGRRRLERRAAPAT